MYMCVCVSVDDVVCFGDWMIFFLLLLLICYCSFHFFLNFYFQIHLLQYKRIIFFGCWFFCSFFPISLWLNTVNVFFLVFHFIFFLSFNLFNVLIVSIVYILVASFCSFTLEFWNNLSLNTYSYVWLVCVSVSVIYYIVNHLNV